MHQLELISEADPSLLVLEIVVAVWERGGGRWWASEGEVIITPKA